MQQKTTRISLTARKTWLRGPDLNRQPSGYEPDELPDCSTPRCVEKIGGGRRIRTFEGVANRFTVCPLWPAWVSLHKRLFKLEPVEEIESTTSRLQVECSAN